MNVAFNVSGRASAEARASRPSVPLTAARLGLLPLSLVLWGTGVAQTNPARLGLYGLPAILPPVFYAGVALLLVSAGIEFGRGGARLSQARLALHAVILVVMLYATAPLIYKDERYAWLYKTAGVVQYVAAHGSLNRSVDIYQNWPGFFALAAWFDKVAGVSSPLDYAKWAQLVFELGAVPLLYTIYQALRLPVGHRWLAIMLYAGSNWIAQDYFSPQALGTMLSLGAMAVVARWMFVATNPGRHSRPRADVDGDTGTGTGIGSLRLREAAPYVALLLLLFFVITMTHELSPYIVVVQLAALAIAGLVRPAWIGAAAAVIALAYLAPSFSFVNSHYGLLSSFGHVFSNLLSPNTSGTGGSPSPPASHKVIAYSADALTAGVWLLAVAGAWLRRRSRRTVIALALLAFTPVFVLVAGAYGNEGILRVYLFSLPWAAALASFALLPLRDSDRLQVAATGQTAAFGRLGDMAEAQAQDEAGGGRRAVSRSLRATVPLAVAVALFFPAFFGNDAAYLMPSAEVSTVSHFEQTAVPGPVLMAINNAPVSSTARYTEFPVGSIFDSPGFITAGEEHEGIAAFLARTLVDRYFGAGRTGPAYVMLAPSMTAYNQAFGVTPPENLATLESSLAKSPYWKRIVSHDDTVIYELTAAAAHVTAGPAAASLPVSVP